MSTLVALPADWPADGDAAKFDAECIFFISCSFLDYRLNDNVTVTFWFWHTFLYNLCDNHSYQALLLSVEANFKKLRVIDFDGFYILCRWYDSSGKIFFFQGIFGFSYGFSKTCLTLQNNVFLTLRRFFSA